MITFAGFSHHTTPVHIRERLTPPEDDIPAILRRARRAFGASAIVSTCNRLELYLVGRHQPEAVRSFLAGELGTSDEVIGRHVIVTTGRNAVQQLFRVASGLDSMVLGETEILGQVRAGFSAATSAGTQDAMLSRLFHAAVRAGRRARNETNLGDGALSVSTIAVRQARHALGTLADARVLLIGAGEAGHLVARALHEAGATEITVANRTQERAAALAQSLGSDRIEGRAIGLDAVPAALRMADIVVGAIGGTSPVLATATIQRAMTDREGAPLLIVDISMPRSVDPASRGVPGVTLFDIDDLQAEADRAGAVRAAAARAAEAIVEEEVDRFVDWAERLHAAPTIAAITDRAEALRRAEVTRIANRLRLDGDERAHVEELFEALSRGFANKLLAAPIAALNEHHNREGYLSVARTLFGLDEPTS